MPSSLSRSRSSRPLLALLAALSAAMVLAACSPAEEVGGDEVASEDAESTESASSDETSSEESPSEDGTVTDAAPPEVQTGSEEPTEGATDGDQTSDESTTDTSGQTGGGDDGDSNVPTQAFPPVPEGEPDPCILSEDQIEDAIGQRLTQLGPSGESAAFRMCTYGEPADPGSVDIALVELEAASEEAGEDLDGEAWLEDWIQQAREGNAEAVEDLDALGDGTAVLITTDDFSSEAWAYAGGFVYGVISQGFDDNDSYAQALLQAILDEAGS